MTTEPEDVEERCLDAEAWADELALWAGAKPDDPEARDAQAVAAMLRALSKSIRLSLFAEGSPVDRGYLIEELEGAIATARAIAMGVRPGRVGRASVGPAPPALTGFSATVTAPPPPGKSPQEIWAQRLDSDPPHSEP